jgi:signal transduction histidine kinase
MLVAIVGLLAALAVVYTNADGVERVAADAAAQQQAEAALGAVSVARAALGQILLAAPSDTETASALAEDARALLTELDSRLAAVEASLADAAALASVHASADETAEAYLALVGEREYSSAAALATSRLGPALDQLTTEVAAERDRRATAIAAARAEVGRLATASRFLVALGIPGATALGWLLLARRRRRRLALADDLEHERELNRSKDQMIANISHELRTPLTGIYGAALAMEESGLTDPHLTGELTGIIVDQSAELTRMVDDLLVTARADAGRLRFEITPVAVIDEARAVVREYRRSGKLIQFGCARALVLADPLRLRQVLRNLLSNAVRYGGKHVGVIGRLVGDTYELAVVDDGPGVGEDLVARLFTRFVHTGDRPLTTGSVGLGLAITKLLVEGMEGSVSYSRTEKCSRFTVRLRAVPQEERTPPADGPRRPTAIGATPACAEARRGDPAYSSSR